MTEVRTAREAEERTGPRAWPTVLIALGVGLGVNSLVGPFALGLIDYPLSETLRNQTIGLDAVNLVVVAPLSVAAGILGRRGHRVAPFLAVAVGSFTAYMFVQYVVGPDYLHYPGTLALQLALFVAGWTVAVSAWGATRDVGLPALDPQSRRRHSSAVFALGGFVALRYLAIIPAAIGGEPIPDESVADPAMYWTIVLMDLGIFLPIAVASGLALRRGTAWGQRALYGAVGWFVLVTVAVMAMSITMVVNDDPYAAVGQVALFVVTAVAVVAYAVRIHRPLLGSPTPTPTPTPTPGPTDGGT